MVDIKSWLIGYTLGISGKPLPLTAKKEPVAYLYNGVRLPDINPIWDKEAYPYAILCDTSYWGSIDGNAIYLYMLPTNAVKVTVDSDGEGSVYPSADKFDAGFSRWTPNPDHYAYLEKVNGWTVEAEKRFSGGTVPPIWANFDLLNEDGSVYLAASEPIPVYE